MKLLPSSSPASSASSFSLSFLLLPSTPFCEDSNQEIYTHKEQKPTGKQDANSLIAGQGLSNPNARQICRIRLKRGNLRTFLLLSLSLSLRVSGNPPNFQKHIWKEIRRSYCKTVGLINVLSQKHRAYHWTLESAAEQLGWVCPLPQRHSGHR